MGRYQLDDLLYLMARLRDPQDGCPWDLKQDFKSILPHTLEEAYEVADAIEQEDFSHLKDELGDLLFQVVFYARLGQEQQHFDFVDIVDNLVAKLVRRHPHVFPEGTLESRLPPGTEVTEAEIKANWERIKAEERAAKPEVAETRKSLLDGVASSLPSLQHAEKIQRRAANHGFDWPDVGPVFDKLREEIDEIIEAKDQPAPQQQDRLEDEVGDLLFCCVNLARFLSVNPDQALRRANRKFIRRFQRMETYLAEEKKVMDDCDLESLDSLWERAKRDERGSS